jgi:mandelate racemase
MSAAPPVRLTLDKVVVRVIQVPLRRPIVAKLGEFKNFPYILTDVLTKEGVIGHSYLEPYRVTATKSIVALIEDVAEQQRGKPVAPFDRFEEAVRSLHLLGRQGVMLIAIAALDMAMWDALAKAVGVPLVVLLGGAVGPVRAYNTNGLWLIPLERIADEASSLVAEADFKALKIRLGRDSVKDDLKAICRSAPSGRRRHPFDERLQPGPIIQRRVAPAASARRSGTGMVRRAHRVRRLHGLRATCE